MVDTLPGRRLVLIVALLAIGCVTETRLRSRSYGSEGAPYLSAGSATSLERHAVPVHRLILIGDGGAPLRDDPTLDTLSTWADAIPGRTTVLFLGDNVYPDGLRSDQRGRGERILRQQIEATRADKIFLPGNHDWGFSARVMMQEHRLENEQRFIEAHAMEGADFEPKNGCPGPVVKTLVPAGRGLVRGVSVIAVDFHWWLLPEPSRPHCGAIVDTQTFLEELDRQLELHADESVVVAAHHPLRSGGPHGGLTRGFWTDLGASLFYRLSGTSLQDLWEPSYAQMIRVVSKALGKHPPLAVVAGHDHSLQLLEGGGAARLMVVSGAASAGQITGVTAIDGTLFAHAHTGFVVFDFFRFDDAADALRVQVVETGTPRPVYEIALELRRDARSDDAAVRAPSKGR